MKLHYQKNSGGEFEGKGPVWVGECRPDRESKALIGQQVSGHRRLWISIPLASRLTLILSILCLHLMPITVPRP